MAKRYWPKMKFQVVLEILSSERTVAQAAKAYGVHPNSINA
jgi:transposase-like protein